MKKSDETKARILEVSQRLFNALGTGEVSTNHIASTAGMSPGNLYYHYRNKTEIIHGVVERLIEDMKKLWQVPEGATLQSGDLRNKLEGTLTLMWDYRFFCREMNVLLAGDVDLNNKYRSARDEQFRYIRQFLENLFKRHELTGEAAPESMDSLMKISQLVSDYWLSSIDLEGGPVDSIRIQEGVNLMLECFRPYLYPDAFRELVKTLQVSDQS